jgi:purine catabolism regulator
LITVRNFIEEVQEYGVKLVAGQNGLESTIQHLNVQEVSEKSTRIKRNSLIMTTFYAFKDVEQILEQLKWYVNEGITGVGFHSAVYKEIPIEVIEYANENDLPLFFIPTELPYYILFEKFNFLLQKESSDVKAQLDRLNENMLEAVLQEKDVHHIIHLIGSSLEKPVIFLNEDLTIISLWSNGIITRSDIFNMVNYLQSEKANMFNQARMENRFVSGKFEELNRNFESVTVFPLEKNLRFFGYLVILNSQLKQLFQEVIIKHGITALMLDQLKKNAVKEYEKNEDIKLFEAIFQGKKHLNITEKAFNYRVSKVKYVFIAQQRDTRLLKECYLLIDQVVRTFDPNCLMWIYDKSIIGVLQKKVTPKHLQQIVQNSGDRKISIGVSSRINEFSPKTITKAYEQALLSMDYALDHSNNYAYWNEIGFEKIINFIYQSDLLNDFDIEILQPLIDYDKENRTELLLTLKAYLDTFFSLKESGNQLFLHPNTIKYRVIKIQELLNLDLNDPINYMNMMIALQMYLKKVRIVT